MVVAEVCSSMKYPKRCQYKHAKQKKYHVRNWAEYNEGLRRRGDLTVWFDEEAIANWKADKTGKPGGQRVYSDMAIETGLEFSLHCPNHAHGQKFYPDSQNCQNTFCRDRIAPNCTIRHPVRPIVALQRRMRFSARLAWFFKIRCHQRRAIRPEQASFSVLVSNLDFRVPRLRQIGERALTGPCGWREKRPPERLRIEAGATAA